ncbi:hypothetical protein [Mycoplasma suis]|uniref:Uncharacterized protein n=2 Tax=Mycoplasma suis TaxID=57372 RepID=F0QQ41_MYCSL|nr:hypothetical protein [Mycoplasma suis]ADX97611.1 hypothetical protein MSU_0067 [Mycoplasma suis str. Illinois]CBZ40146.1 hypothetical protein MSUIS_00530 [Mycoplasma suis KI3806]
MNPFIGIISWFSAKFRAISRAFNFFWWIVYDNGILRFQNYVKGIWNKYVWVHITYVRDIIKAKLSFLAWKAFPSRASMEEVEKYQLFVEAMGGWANVLACSCSARSWHFKILHNFLIDSEKIEQFGMEILFWEWPYLKLVPRTYSKWIFKRLKRFTDMPIGIHIRYKKSFYHPNY